MQLSWIYTLEHPLGDIQKGKIVTELLNALSEWKAHGTPVAAELHVEEGQFLCIRALNAPSGCSIDWLHRTVSAQLAAQGLPAAGNEWVWFRGPGGATERIHHTAVREALAAGTLTPDTLVYDTHGYLEGLPLLRPLRETWLQRWV